METPAKRDQAISALRGAYAAFNRGDITAALEPLDPEIEWTEPAEFPGGGTYHGQAAVKAYLTQSRAAWAEVSSEPERFIAAGDRIVVLVHARVRPNAATSGKTCVLRTSTHSGMARPCACRRSRTGSRRCAGSESKSESAGSGTA